MAKQTFVADAILTAAQMNALQGNDFNQTVNTSTASYVLVASDAGTRRVMNSSSSTTITVNTSLFAAGDTLTILNIGAGVCTVTAGTATVSTTGTLALVQNAGGTLYFTSAGVSVFQADGVAASSSGLTFISGASFTNVASVTFPNSTFTSTYTNYSVQLEANASSPSTLTMQFRDNSGTKSGANYYGAVSTLIYTGTAGTVLSSGTTSFGAGSCASNQGVFSFFVGRPNEATYYPTVTMTGFGQDRSFTGGFIYGVAEAMTGLVISASVNITGKYKVYGLANS